MTTQMVRNMADVITTRPMSGDEREGVLGSIGAMLIAGGYSPTVHSRGLLNYQKVLKQKRGFFVGLLVPFHGIAPGVGVPVGRGGVRSASVIVQVTELPVGFTVDEGSRVDITVALAFGVSAPRSELEQIRSILSPYAISPDYAREHAAEMLVGKTFQKNVPGVACEHCGFEQVVSIPVTVERVEGNRAYGPGGSSTIICSNPRCGRTFEVDWDRVIFQIEMT